MNLRLSVAISQLKYKLLVNPSASILASVVFPHCLGPDMRTMLFSADSSCQIRT